MPRRKTLSFTLDSLLHLFLRQIKLVQINIKGTGIIFGCYTQIFDLHNLNIKKVLKNGHTGYTPLELNYGYHLYI